MSIRSVTLILCAALAVAGCKRKEVMLFDDQVYKAKADTTREDRHAFTITVSPVSASLLGAKEAARFEATKYCMRAFGSSDMEWTLGPDAADDTLQVTDDTLVLAGRCAR